MNVTETVPAEALRAVIASHYGSIEQARSYGFGQKLLRLLGENPDPLDALVVPTKAALDGARVHALDTVVTCAAQDDAESMTVRVDEMHALLNEMERHRSRADLFQADNTRVAERTIGRRVRAFHERFGHPIFHTPRVPDPSQVRFRLKLIAEEFFELVEASVRPDPYIRGAYETVKLHIAEGDIDVDLPEFADALGDIAYVVEGTNVVFGIDAVAVLGEIQRANMEKDPVYVAAKDAHHKAPDPTQKPTKPATWRAPDIKAVLIAQGWREAA